MYDIYGRFTFFFAFAASSTTFFIIAYYIKLYDPESYNLLCIFPIRCITAHADLLYIYVTYNIVFLYRFIVLFKHASRYYINCGFYLLPRVSVCL